MRGAATVELAHRILQSRAHANDFALIAHQTGMDLRAVQQLPAHTRAATLQNLGRRHMSKFSPAIPVHALHN